MSFKSMEDGQRHADLMAERRVVFARADQILSAAERGSREFTDTERNDYESAVARIKQIDAEAARLDTPTPRPQPGYQPPDMMPNGPVIEAGYGGPRLQSFKNTPAGREQAYRMGRWLAANLLQHEQSMIWCRQNGVGLDIMNAAATSPNTAGGALVPEPLSTAIIELMDTYGLMRQSADVVPMTSDTLSIPRRTGGLTAYFIGENQEGTESDGTWDNVNLVAKKVMVLTRMSSEIAEDAIVSMADKLTMEIALAFALKEDQCGLIGTGTSTYGGMIGVLVKAIDGDHALAKVEAASGHDTFAEVDADDLLKLMAAVPLYARQGAAWYCSPTAKSLIIDAINMSGGGNTAQILASAAQEAFLGYPVRMTPIMNDDATATLNGGVMIAFGNMAKAVTMGTRRDIRVQLSEHRYFELDQVGVKGTERFDINVHDLGSATVKSPFAVLVGKS